MPPPTLRTLAIGPSVDLVLLAAVAGSVALYGVGVRRRAERGGSSPWPPARTTSFVAGVVVVWAATGSGLARYEDVLFSMHVVQHVLLGMVAPLLLCLGAPVTLALQATPRRTKVALLWLLHHPVARALAHPVTVWTLFGGTLFALYFSPAFELSLRNGSVHVLVHLHFLAAGYLFSWTAVGPDPRPRPLGHPARLLFVLLAVPFHALLGLAILTGRDRPIGEAVYATADAPWRPDLAADQATAAGVLWAVGEVFGVLLGALVLAGWMRADAREQAREDRRLLATSP